MIERFERESSIASFESTTLPFINTWDGLTSPHKKKLSYRTKKNFFWIWKRTRHYIFRLFLHISFFDWTKEKRRKVTKQTDCDDAKRLRWIDRVPCSEWIELGHMNRNPAVVTWIVFMNCIIIVILLNWIICKSQKGIWAASGDRCSKTPWKRCMN